MPDNGRIIPSEAAKSVCTFTILSGGAAVSRTYGVLSIVVHKEINRIPSAVITLSDGDAAKQTFSISNTADFEPGKRIELKAGYRGIEETIFKGIVIRHSIKVRRTGSVLVIECRDIAVKMTVVPKSKYFRDTTDSDVMETLIGSHGVDKDIVTTDITHEELVQYNTTDWDFMLCRADANGLLCIPNDGKITIAKPDFSAEAVLTVQYGATVHLLDAEIDARFQQTGISAAAWSPGDGELLSGDAEDPDTPMAGNLSFESLAGVIGDDPYRLQHTGALKQAELQQWANAAMLKHRLAKVRGKVTIDGIATVLPGMMIRLQGVGERFEGKLFVTGVRHQVAAGMWSTVFQFGLDPEWFAQTYNVQQPMAGALLPAVQGLQIGIVTKLEGDPEGQNRIMVRLPMISADDDGIWSRVSTLDAGANRGTFILPEIGDEVIVGFLNNDPRHAVILGMCNSAKNPAPLTAGDDNNEKGYVSRSGMKMIFNDDKKTIQIETPGSDGAPGNKLLISEEDTAIKLEDQNGNKFTMDTNGIKLDSILHIELNAPSGNFKLTDMTGNSIKGEPGGITVQAASKLTLGGAMVEISGSQLTVSAAMAQFSGIVQGMNLIATAGVVSPSYTPGAGNVM